MSNRTWRERQEEKKDRKKGGGRINIFFITIDYTSKGSVCLSNYFDAAGCLIEQTKGMTADKRTLFSPLKENATSVVTLKSGSLFISLNFCPFLL